MSWLANTSIARSYRTLGPLGFWSLIAAALFWIAAGIKLTMDLKWPDAYGFHCHGRGCLIVEIWRSPVLIAPGHRHLEEIGLFAWLWALPAAILVVLARGLMKKRPKLTIFASDPTE